MALTKFAALFTIAAMASAASDREIADIELGVYMKDIGANIKDYLSMAKANPQESIPPAVMSAYAEQMTAKDDSYTTWFDQVDPTEVNYMITGVPWYSSRLAPAIDAALAAAGINTAAATSSSASSSSTSTSSSASSTSTSTSSSASSTSSSATSASASKTVEQQSTASSTSHTIAAQTENGANRAVVGLGAGIVAAGALLL